MSIKNEHQDHCLPLAGELFPDSKIHRFHAPGDKPGRDSGWYWLHPTGEGFCTSWHPHSTVIWHGSSHRSGRA
jgi:hypothetical protein